MNNKRKHSAIKKRRVKFDMTNANFSSVGYAVQPILEHSVRASVTELESHKRVAYGTLSRNTKSLLHRTLTKLRNGKLACTEPLDGAMLDELIKGNGDKYNEVIGITTVPVEVIHAGKI